MKTGPVLSHRRALVIRLGALGDVLLTRRLTYSLALAGFRTTLFVPARRGHILRADPWIDDVIDAESQASTRHFTGGSTRRPRKFDAAVVVSLSEDLRTFAARSAPIVVVVPPAAGTNDVQISRQWTRACSSLAEPFEGPLPRLHTNKRERLRDGATVIHPGSGSRTKNWPIDRFRAMADGLAARGHRLTWVRGPAEEELLRDVSAVDVLDQPTIGELASTLAAASLFVGNDSGVSHLAAAVGASTLTIFGPTSASVWKPDGANVRTIQASGGDFSKLTPEMILAALGA